MAVCQNSGQARSTCAAAVAPIIEDHRRRAQRMECPQHVGPVAQVASIAVAVAILRTPNIFGFTAESFQGMPDSSVNAELLLNIFTLSFSIAIIIAIIVAGVDMAKAAFGLLRMNYKRK